MLDLAEHGRGTPFSNPYRCPWLGRTVRHVSKPCACPRCGFESNSWHGRWRDRHPAAAVCAGVFVGLPAGFILVCIMLAYPWFTIPVTIIVCAVLLNLATRRRAAIAARAEWEHREMMVRAMQPPGRPPAPDPQQMHDAAWQPDVAAVRPRSPAPWHIITQWPTQRFRNDKP